jgi:hypothetical protein
MSRTCLLSSEQQAAVYADDAGDHARARAAYQRIAEIAASRLSTPSGLRSYLAAQSNLALDDLAQSTTPSPNAACATPWPSSSATARPIRRW